MGAPELPGDAGDEDLRPTEIIHLGPLEDSDNESMDTMDDAYAYYQPLDNNDMAIDTNLMDDDDEPNSVEVPSGIETTDRVEQTNMPHIESVDAVIVRQVWNEPRPQELQIELDNTRTAQILSAMANFTLPSIAVPDWAVGVPEERWKEELLQRIRQRKEPPKNVVVKEMKSDTE